MSDIETLEQAADLVARGLASCYGIHSDGRAWVGFGHHVNSDGREVVAPAVVNFLPVRADAVRRCQFDQTLSGERVETLWASDETVLDELHRACAAHPELKGVAFTMGKCGIVTALGLSFRPPRHSFEDMASATKAIARDLVREQSRGEWSRECGHAFSSPGCPACVLKDSDR